MAKHNTQPRVVYCQSEEQAIRFTNNWPDSRALTTGPGTLTFHRLIAEHGAGVFTTLYVAPAVRGKFMCPAGAIIEDLTKCGLCGMTDGQHATLACEMNLDKGEPE